jgi:hypothetical protein
MANDAKKLARETLRWLVIAASGAYGFWQLGYAVRRGFAVHLTGDWADILAVFVLIVPLLVAAPFIAVAYLCLRRRYRKLFLVLGVVGCIGVFAELMALPDQLNLYPFMERQVKENAALGLLGLPIGLLMLFGPAYAAAWFYGLCHRLAYKEPAKQCRTRATHWLINVGVLCLLLPTMIGMIVTFNNVQSPDVSASLDSQMRWIMGSTVIGLLLMFLGVVHRQPIAEAKETAASPAIGEG